MTYTQTTVKEWRSKRGPLSQKLYDEFLLVKTEYDSQVGGNVGTESGIVADQGYLLEAGGPRTSSAAKLDTISFANEYDSGSAQVMFTTWQNTGVTFGMSTSDTTQSIITASAASEVYYYTVIGQPA